MLLIQMCSRPALITRTASSYMHSCARLCGPLKLTAALQERAGKLLHDALGGQFPGYLLARSAAVTSACSIRVAGIPQLKRRHPVAISILVKGNSIDNLTLRFLRIHVECCLRPTHMPLTGKLVENALCVDDARSMRLLRPGICSTTLFHTASADGINHTVLLLHGISKRANRAPALLLHDAHRCFMPVPHVGWS